MFDLAGTLFGNRRDPVAQGSTLTATGSTASADGTAYLVMDADVTPAEGVGDDTDQTVIDVPTSPSVAEGDEVIMTLVGDGPLKTPVVMANPGFGDRMAASVSNAETLAEQAEAVATATGQHFWPDSSGVHVTEVTQGEWSDSTSPNYHSGANVLLNALGQLFRDGLNNILAIVSGTDPGVAIYDGEGNSADNIMALFSKALIRIGGRLLGTGTSTASVQFFQSDASQTDIKATHTVGSTTPPTGPDDVYGVNHGVQVTTSTDDSELGAGAEGHAAWAALDLFADVNPDYEAGYAMLEATTGGTPYDSSTDPTLGVLRQVADNGTEAASVYMAAPTLEMHDIARYKMCRVPMEQAIAALTTPLYSNSSNVAITTANTDISGPSVTVPAGTYIIVVAYTFQAASGSGTRVTTIGYKPGSGSAQYNTFVQGSRASVRLSMFNIVHITAQTSFTAYVRSDQAISSASGLYIGMTRIS